MSQNTYYPGETVRVTADVSVLGVLANALTLTLYVVDPTGATTTYGAPTNDATGVYHQDFNLAASPAFGRWSYYWESVGTQLNQQGVSSPQYFYVAPIGQP